MAIIYLVLEGVIYGPIQSLNTLSQVQDYLVQHIIIASKGSQSSSIYLRCLSTDSVIRQPLGSNMTSVPITSGVYQVYLNDGHASKEDQDPQSYVSVCRASNVFGAVGNNNANPLDRIRKALDSSTAKNHPTSNVNYESMGQLLQVMRIAAPILEEIHDLLKSTETMQRPKTWKKRLATVMNPRFQPGKKRYKAYICTILIILDVN